MSTKRVTAASAMTAEQHAEFMSQAVALSFEAMRSGRGAPFGCVIARDGKVVATGMNDAFIEHDPTAHCEVVAIRNACKALKSLTLEGCVLYTSCFPCPLCTAAISWAKLDHVYYANGRSDAAAHGFGDGFVYEAVQNALEGTEGAIPCDHLGDASAVAALEEWTEKHAGGEPPAGGSV